MEWILQFNHSTTIHALQQTEVKQAIFNHRLHLEAICQISWKGGLGFNLLI